MKEKSLSVEMIDDALQQTGQDFVEQGLNELKKFIPASRTTKADKENNIKSTQRKLDKHLVLLLNEKLGDKSHWVMPFGKHADGETMRQTAERVLAEKFNKKISAKFYGNAPCGFYKYKYPKSFQAEKNVVGAKIFFFKAQYLEGDVEDKKVEFTWASRDELPELCLEDYNKNVVAALRVQRSPKHHHLLFGGNRGGHGGGSGGSSAAAAAASASGGSAAAAAAASSSHESESFKFGPFQATFQSSSASSSAASGGGNGGRSFDYGGNGGRNFDYGGGRSFGDYGGGLFDF